jgi:hypothetical protein
MTRLGTYRTDYRGAAEYVASHFCRVTLSSSTKPHVFERTPDVGTIIWTALHKKITYNEKFAEPRFMDKFRAYPTLRSLQELREVTSRGRRTWLSVRTSAGSAYNSPEVRAYLDQHAKVVFESYHAKVLLIGGENETTNLTARYGAE